MISLISTKELQRLRDVDSTFTKALNAKNARISELELQNKILAMTVKERTRQRDEKGRFLKK